MNHHGRHKNRRNASSTSVNEQHLRHSQSFHMLEVTDDEKMVRAQATMVDAIMKVSSDDMGRLVNYLQQRIELEESYRHHLARITDDIRYNECNSDSSLEKTIGDYLNIGDVLCPTRDVLISTMKAELENLIHLKDNHEKLSLLHGRAMDKIHTQYMITRNTELPATRDAYTQKCMEIEKSQLRYATPSSPLPPVPSTPMTPSFPRMTESISSPTTNGSISSSAHSESGREHDRSAPQSISTHRASVLLGPPPSSPHRRLKGFVKKQLQLSSSHDKSRQNVKIAKLRVEANEADERYRKAVRKLNMLTERRAAVTNDAIKALHNQLREKADTVKNALSHVLTVENTQMKHVQEVFNNMQQALTSINTEQNARQYDETLDTKNFPLPTPIYYVNHHVGECRDLMFGITLSEYAQHHHRAPPLLVTKCIEAVENMGGLTSEGIYRISGQQCNVEKIKQNFERNEDEAVLGEPDVSDDVYTVATVLKTFLRELGSPLFPFKLDDRMAYSRLTEEEVRLRELKKRVAKLPSANYLTLKAITIHLAKLEEHVEKNKMTANNLSLIFTPAIFQDHNQAQLAPGEWFEDSVLQDLLTHHTTLFTGNALPELPKEDGSATVTLLGEEHPEDDDSFAVSLSTNSSSFAYEDDLPSEPDGGDHHPHQHQQQNHYSSKQVSSDSQLSRYQTSDKLLSVPRPETNHRQVLKARPNKFKNNGLRLHLGEISNKSSKRSSDIRLSLIPSIVSATFPSLTSWRSQDSTDAPSTPAPGLRRTSSTDRKLGKQRHRDDIPMPPPHTSSTAALYPPITRV